MSSPIPPDPYATLGVPKDADISTIRSAHRKLVLKHHPDRIKDESQKEKGKNEFQKIQQAYELLSDPVTRERYDNKITLAELRKDAMMRDSSVRGTTTYPMRPAASNTQSFRDFPRENLRYRTEERAPAPAPERRPPPATSYFDNGEQSSYFDVKMSYDEPTSRAGARKTNEFERRGSASKVSDKERKNNHASAKAVFGTVFAAAKMAAQAKKTRDNGYAASAEARDRAKRDDRSTKHTSHRTYVEDVSDSDSDTVSRVTDSTVRPSRPGTRSSPYEVEPERMRRRSPERAYRRRGEDDDSYDEGGYKKWHDNYNNTREYIKESKKGRPEMHRVGSGRYDTDRYSYHDEQMSSRRSGSDSDKRATSTETSRRTADEGRERPSMPTTNSAPINLRGHVQEREPVRSSTGSAATRDHRKEMPSLSRSQTMPAPRPSKKDNAPSKASGLRHGETHQQDSGYGSSSSPHTPEMRGESPPREEERKPKSTKYQIVDPENDEEFGRRPRVGRVLNDSGDRRRHVRSPEASSRRPERPRMTEESRSTTARHPVLERPSGRPSARRVDSEMHETRSPRTSPPISRDSSSRGELFGEIPTDRKPAYSRKYPMDEVNQAPRRDPSSASYSSYPRREAEEDRDYMPESKFRDHVRGSKRPSVY